MCWGLRLRVRGDYFTGPRGQLRLLARGGEEVRAGLEFSRPEQVRGTAYIPVYYPDDDRPRYLPRTFLELLD